MSVRRGLGEVNGTRKVKKERGKCESKNKTETKERRVIGRDHLEKL